MNLCVNARDAMPKGGTIKISAKRIPGKVVKQKRINAIAPQYVSISVSDTGWDG
jgi:signal transduction histidine kinase